MVSKLLGYLIFTICQNFKKLQTRYYSWIEQLSPYSTQRVSEFPILEKHASELSDVDPPNPANPAPVNGPSPANQSPFPVFFSWSKKGRTSLCALIVRCKDLTHSFLQPRGRVWATEANMQRESRIGDRHRQSISQFQSQKFPKLLLPVTFM